MSAGSVRLYSIFHNSILVIEAQCADIRHFSARYPVTCNVYTGNMYNATSEKEHRLSACTVDIIHELELRLVDYLSVQADEPCDIYHMYLNQVEVKIRFNIIQDSQYIWKCYVQFFLLLSISYRFLRMGIAN